MKKLEIFSFSFFLISCFWVAPKMINIDFFAEYCSVLLSKLSCLLKYPKKYPILKKIGIFFSRKSFRNMISIILS